MPPRIYNSKIDPVEDTAARIRLTSQECIALIDRCLALGNRQRFDVRLWHYIRAVLQLSSACLKTVAKDSTADIYEKIRPLDFDDLLRVNDADEPTED